MIQTEQHILDKINSPVRTITAKAELYAGSALVKTFNHSDVIRSIEIERVGDESKFFGYVICQKLNIKLIDLAREITTDTSNYFKIHFDSVDCLPAFYVNENHRDENTNELSITAYDLIYQASKKTVQDIHNLFFISTANEDENPTQQLAYSVRDFAQTAAGLIGAKGFKIEGVPDTDTCFDTFYKSGANYDGTENLREALADIAEVTQTICFLNHKDELVFKRLDVSGNAVYDITKSRYVDLDSSSNRRLSTLVHATELGDNLTVSTTETGTTQFIRDNPFWDMRDDTATLLENALLAVGGLTINQFQCEWRGNYLLELGDKIALTTKDNEIVYSYLLDDSIEYDGSYKQKSQWNYAENDEETAANPTSLGDAIKQTYAKVDKANKQIDLVASKTEANGSAIAALQLNTDSISASVERIEKNAQHSFENINGEIELIKERAELAVTPEDVVIQIQKELQDGVDTVRTSTGYTFDENGLTIDKTDSEMKTQITEDGMTIYRNDEEVLTVNNTGVDAANLHATTYLWIGTNSRFEDYDGNRTGCFWVGGE